MPLHLLGKKSWNIYNADNIARIERDEAAARAREQAEERRMQDEDATRRLAILRGEEPLPLASRSPDEPPALPSSSSRLSDPAPRQKRKRFGEDDTDFEMRVAQERALAGNRIARERVSVSAVAPPGLVDGKGHMTLFEAPRREETEATKDEKAEREAAKLEAQFRVRLSSAAGRDGRGLTDGGPWYVTGAGRTDTEPRRDAWGKEDAGRKVRDRRRLDASDPLAMMKRASAKMRKIGKERKANVEDSNRELEKVQELQELKREERRRERRRRRKEEDGGEKRQGEQRPVRSKRGGKGVSERGDDRVDLDRQRIGSD